MLPGMLHITLCFSVLQVTRQIGYILDCDDTLVGPKHGFSFIVRLKTEIFPNVEFCIPLVN